jgi:hypothetical protein
MFYLLDAGGASLYYFFFALFVAFVLFAILAEAVVMILMKYNLKFKKAFLDSFLANLATFTLGFVLIEFVSDFFNSTELFNLFVLYIMSVLMEWAVLFFLNRAKPAKESFVVAVVMNLPTYAFLVLIGMGR